MPASAGNSPIQKQAAGTDDGRRFAVLVESLYLANLLILPLIAFIILAALFLRRHGSLPPLAEAHLEQTVSASVWIAVMFFIAAISTMTLNLLGIEDVALWTLVILTFTILHATMVLLGAFGLSKALAGKGWRYPLVGKPLPPGCPL